MNRIIEYTLTETTLHITDSCSIPGRDFNEILTHIADENPGYVFFRKNSIALMGFRWAVCNFLYRAGYRREDMRDIVFPCSWKWYQRIAYPVIGILVWPFIR